MKRFLEALAVLPLIVMITSCGGGGGGGGEQQQEQPQGGTTTVSGKVTLSGTSGKPSFLNKIFSSPTGTPLPGATVRLFNADRPDWLSPVAETISDVNGDYTLSTLKYSSNNGNAYQDGDPIPTGNYTLLARKYDDSILPAKTYVKVQTVVKRFDGIVTNVILEAIDCSTTSAPSVVSMFGLAPNADGTFGGAGTQIPNNAALQITFSMPMARASVNVISVTGPAGAVTGQWKMSPDLLTTTFYPSNPLSDGTHTVTIGVLASSVYDKPLPTTVTGTFTSIAADIVNPTGALDTPDPGEPLTNIPVNTPIRIGATEALDINTFVVTSSPSIGDKPGVRYIGYNASKAYKYIYEIDHPTLNLNTVYTITVSGAKDMAGNPLNAVSFSFQTQATESPTVVSTTPTDLSNNIDVSTAVSAVFSQDMLASSITGTTTTFTVKNGITPISASSIAYNATTKTATFTPSAKLAYSTTYTATITTGAQNLSTVGLASDYVWTFTTAAAPPPTTGIWDTSTWDGSSTWGI